MNEATLFAAHRSVGPSDHSGPVVRVASAARTVDCLCGGYIRVDVESDQAAGAAVLAHQSTAIHRLWWNRARHAGWGA